MYINRCINYCIPITRSSLDLCNVNIVLHLKAVDGLSREGKMKKAMKLHKQFSHASKEKLLQLLKDSGCVDEEFKKCVEEYCDSCELCQQYKKPPLRPIVSLPLAQKFNQCVCMDLKEFKHNKVWILHLIDAATIYYAACLINTKKKEDIVG